MIKKLFIKFFKQEISFRKFIFITLLLPIPLIIFVGIMLYLYDALQAWHKPYFRDIAFSTEYRLQAKGIIDYYDFDSVIIGSSMLAKTPTKYAEKILGGEWINITMGGLSLHNRAIILKYMLKKRSPRHIIISLDWFTRKINEDSRKFEFLYDSNDINNMKVYLNYRSIFCAITWSNSPHCIGDSKDYHGQKEIVEIPKKLEKLQAAVAWIENNKENKRFKPFVDRVKAESKIPFTVEKTEIEWDKHSAYLEKNVFSMVRDNPNTNFHFIIPTHTRLTYRIRDEVPNFYEYKIVLEYIVKELETFQNARIYGFDDLDYADNLSNYGDPTHYQVDMNLRHIDCIANKCHILNGENIANYLQIMEQKIKDYDLDILLKP